MLAPAAPPVPVTAPPASAAIVHFGDDQGVAIPRRPAPASHASPARATPRAARPAPLGPALPDGSFGLGHVDTLPSLTATSAPVAASEPAKKRVLTPEQQLAEAQLKASMLK